MPPAMADRPTHDASSLCRKAFGDQTETSASQQWRKGVVCGCLAGDGIETEEDLGAEF